MSLHLSNNNKSSKEELIKEIVNKIKQYDCLKSIRSEHTDLEIQYIFNHNWGVGQKKVEYTAYLLLNEEDNTVVFWEMIKEMGSGPSFLSWIKQNNGTKAIQPENKVDYSWNYGKVRELVAEVTATNGWNFHNALFKRKAMYQGVRS